MIRICYVQKIRTIEHELLHIDHTKKKTGEQRIVSDDIIPIE